MDENQFLALQKRATQNREDVPISLSDIGGSSVDFIGRAEAPVDKAFSDYLKTVQGFAKPLDLYQRGEQAAGIPEMRQTATTLRGQIADIEDILNRAETDVSARSRNSIVTEAQRRGMLGAYQEPFQKKLGTLTTGLGRVSDYITSAGADLGTKVQLALQGQQLEADPYKMKVSLLSDRAARLETGFTADREMRLNILMDKVKQGRQLTATERQEAFEMAKLEKEYSLQRTNWESKATYLKENDPLGLLGLT